MNKTKESRQVREMILGKRPKYMKLTKHFRFTMSMSTMSMSTVLMSTMAMSTMSPIPSHCHHISLTSDLLSNMADYNVA